MATAPLEKYERSAGLVEILDRVLDKGLVVAGDVKVSLGEVELVTIGIRLLVCSIDKAEALGIDWWKFDHRLSPGSKLQSTESDALRKEVRALERRVGLLTRRQAPRTGVAPGPWRAARPGDKRVKGVRHAG